MKNKFALLDIVKEIDKNKCKKHPRYKAIRRPLVECEKCWEVYNRKNENK